MSTTTATTSTRNRNRAVAGVGIAALALGAVAAGVAYNAGQQNAPQAAPAASSSSASQAGTGTTPSTGGNNNKIQPSNAIKAVQQELAELNFYQGPINGYDTAATVSAVQNLQREAGLPQTGHMDPQTRAALLKYLAQGSNTMNS
ncbi:MAG: peptidoglycan-binding domain-containing protein [Candidatus Nanopelagicales bacterium]